MTDVLAAHRWATNAAMIADVARLGYLDGQVLDATYGEGAFWTVFRPQRLTTNDLYKPADFGESYRDLKVLPVGWDAVVFDPPYKLSGTPSTPESDGRYGVETYMPREERLHDIIEGALECYRITGRYLLVKCMDQVEGGRVRWQTDLITRAIEDAGGRKVDRFDFLKAPRPQPGGRRQCIARRCYSTLLVFEKARRKPLSAIEWTDETWNPTVGCSRVSPGCDNCYAIRVAAREMQPAHVGLTSKVKVVPEGRPNAGARQIGLDWTGEVRCLPDRLDTPLRWRKPRRVFVDSMSDLFHPDVPDEFIAKVWNVMAQTPQHAYQVLTKRPQRMAEVLGAVRRCEMGWLTHDGTDPYGGEHGIVFSDQIGWPLPNVWLGVSVENQRYADLRIPHLLATPAAVRFLSIEPLLGPVDLDGFLRCGHDSATGTGTPGEWECDGCGEIHDFENVGTVLSRHRTIKPGHLIDWVIVGGESGPGARPLDIEWIRTILAQCSEARVPVFVKQLGAHPGFKGEPGFFHHYDEPSGLFIKRLDDKKGGNPDEWPDDLRVRQYPKETRAA